MMNNAVTKAEKITGTFGAFRVTFNDGTSRELEILSNTQTAEELLGLTEFEIDLMQEIDDTELYESGGGYLAF